jgi:hypothetical protein
MERKTRFELATSSLARRHSTTELLPPEKAPDTIAGLGIQVFKSATSTCSYKFYPIMALWVK